MYTKLFGSLVHSTIWREPDHVRLVWITMLALSDKAGCVWVSVPGLADAARVNIDQCRDALDRLAAPDPDSRTQVAEGRRIEPIDGGYWLINHAKFQAIRNMDERREQVRHAVQRHRAKKHDVINVITSNPEKSGNPPVSPLDQTRQDEIKEKTLPKMPSRNSGQASLLLKRIRDMAETATTPGQGARTFIRRDVVAGLGPEVLLAYEAVGGAERLLAATGKDLSFLTREFADALNAAKESP